jgi:hypothetical protein
MGHTQPSLDYRQQRAIDAIDRAATDLGIAIKAHAPDTDTVRQAQRGLAALIGSVKTAIISDEA